MTLAAARTAAGEGRVIVLFQPHLYSRTLYLAHELAAALAAADQVVVTDVYAAREEPLPGVTGKLLVERLAEVRPGMTVGWGPSLEEAAELAAGLCRPGDLVLTIGAGDVDRAGRPDTRRTSPVNLKENVGLHKLTTIGTGGPARWFGRPETVAGARRAALLGRAAGASGGGDRARLEPAGRGRGLPGPGAASSPAHWPTSRRAMSRRERRA